MDTNSFGNITGHLLTLTISILCAFWFTYVVILITFFIYSFTFSIRVASYNYHCSNFFYNFVLTMNTQSFGSITGHLITITINILCTFWSAYMIIRITFVIYSFTFRIRETSLINIMISITLFVIHVL